VNIRILKSNLNTNRSIATDISGIYLIKIRSEMKNFCSFDPKPGNVKINMIKLGLVKIVWRN
jgi:hypothetical protein